jgi:hypothetical protein
MASAASAATNKIGANLRVVTDTGKTLYDGRQITGSTTIKTSKNATCLGADTGGSGQKFDLPGATALGAVSDASRNVKALRPLSITDAFDFGLGVCGFGGIESPPNGFWYLKQNHVDATAGGDQTAVKNRDDILWYLIDDFNDPFPAELELRAPAKVNGGEPFTVDVVQYDPAGKRSPAAGVSVGGVTTDAAGKATIDPPATKRNLKLQATRPGAIPSRELTVCQLMADAGCQTGHALRIGGTQKDDRIKSERGPVKVKSYAGTDVVDITKSSDAAPVYVDCGGSKDTLLVAKGQQFKAKGCEKIEKK